MLPGWLIDLLQSPWLPVVLFAGALGDALIGTSLFVFGEVFFLGAGYAIASLNSWWLILCVWLGAFCGDLSSFWVGRYHGKKIVNRYFYHRPKWRLNYYRARYLIKTKGAIAVFTARLSGPLSKFMPFIAGTLHMPTGVFLVVSFLGIIVGSAQFIAVGWLVGHGINQRQFLMTLLTSHPWLSAFVAGLVLLLIVLLLRRLFDAKA